jgi:hypothetical protein
MKPGIYDDLVTENLIREIENLKANFWGQFPHRNIYTPIAPPL